jgi:hypothetical protein
MEKIQGYQEPTTTNSPAQLYWADDSYSDNQKIPRIIELE